MNKLVLLVCLTLFAGSAKLSAASGQPAGPKVIAPYHVWQGTVLIRSNDGLAFSALAERSGAVRVANLDKRAGSFSIDAKTGASYVVFELGRAGDPFRRAKTTNSGDAIVWTARPDTTYRVWKLSALITHSLAKAQAAAGGKLPGRTALQKLSAAANLPAVRKDAVLSMEIAESLAELTGVIARISLRYPRSSPEEYKICVDRPFEIECSLRNRGKKPATASVSNMLISDDWKIEKLDTGVIKTIRPGETAVWRYNVTAPVRSAYELSHPVMAAWKVQAAGATFSLQDNTGVAIVQPFEKSVRIDAGSPTKARMTVSMTSNFPGLSFRGLTVDLDLPDEWTGTPQTTTIDLTGSKSLSFEMAKPADDGHGLRVVAPIFKMGDYRGSKRTITDLFVQMRERARAQGLWQVDVDDGTTEVTTRAGQKCRRAVDFQPGQPCYIYFEVSPNLPVTGDVFVTVSYFDEGTDTYHLQYDSTDPAGGLAAAYKNTPAVRRTNSMTWKAHTFALPDARFTGAQNGQADFRIVSSGSGLCVDSVAVSKFPSSDL